jgi:hypothetical protein
MVETHSISLYLGVLAYFPKMKVKAKSKAVPLHAMVALGRRGI